MNNQVDINCQDGDRSRALPSALSLPLEQHEWETAAACTANPAYISPSPSPGKWIECCRRYGLFSTLRDLGSA